MKNIEKYTNTKDALDAFRAWYKDHKDSVLTMSGWLEAEYEAPSKPATSLLEVAEAVVDEWWITGHHVGYEKIADLENAIAREKAKPVVRNCDRYRTAEEAWYVFTKMCDEAKTGCGKCKFYNPTDISCRFLWLYAEAVKEEAK